VREYLEGRKDLRRKRGEDDRQCKGEDTCDRKRPGGFTGECTAALEGRKYPELRSALHSGKGAAGRREEKLEGQIVCLGEEETTLSSLSGQVKKTREGGDIYGPHQWPQGQASADPS